MNKPEINSERQKAYEENMAKRQASLAMNLKIARNVAGVRHEDLIAPNVSTRITVSRIERGDRDPRLSSIVSLATTLGISPILLLITGDELLALAKEVRNKRKHKPRIRTEDAVALELLSGGTPKQVEQALEIIESWLGRADRVEKIGAVIGTIHKPGEGSYIGRILGRALIAR